MLRKLFEFIRWFWRDIEILHQADKSLKTYILDEEYRDELGCTPTGSKMLETFCEAIRDFEGGPKDANYRNNNPGNFKCSPVGYLPKYGNVRCSAGGFAIFPTYDQGWMYLVNSVKQRASKHPNWTIRDFFLNYAPPADSNPTELYAKFVAKRCGVPTSTTMIQLFG